MTYPGIHRQFLSLPFLPLGPPLWQVTAGIKNILEATFASRLVLVHYFRQNISVVLSQNLYLFTWKICYRPTTRSVQLVQKSILSVVIPNTAHKIYLSYSADTFPSSWGSSPPLVNGDLKYNPGKLCA